ncbi:MAG: alpha/beta hydrolase [Leptospiraceae bacterium]|nr:alpha/beta hydrolase [Leptospiraceae bacterium]
MKAERKQVDVRGSKLAYQEWGEGPVVLCLHALGHDSDDYVALQELPGAHRFRFIALDFPGHGASQAGKADSAQAYACGVEDFLRKLNVRRLYIAGNSIGGAVALRLAMFSEIEVLGLILANPGGLDVGTFPGPQVIRLMSRFFRAGARGRSWYSRLFSLYYRSVLPTNTSAARARRRRIVEHCYEIAPLLARGWESFGRPEEDLTPYIEKVRCPVLFTWAMKDRFVQYSRNKKSIRRFSRASVSKYRVGHCPALEAPERYMRDLCDFLDACESRDTMEKRPAPTLKILRRASR